MPRFTELVNADIDVTVEEFVDSCSDRELDALRERITRDGSSITPNAERAYYALRDGDMETVRRFVCDCAGRIA